jgi:hypothetical protein
VRYLKFREPYTVEPSACRHANKTGMIVINLKSWPVQMGAVRSYSDYLEGSMDLGHNCQVGTHTHGGGGGDGDLPPGHPICSVLMKSRE